MIKKSKITTEENQKSKSWYEIWLPAAIQILGLVIVWITLRSDMAKFSIQRNDKNFEIKRDYVNRFTHSIPCYFSARKQLVAAGIDYAMARLYVIKRIPKEGMILRDFEEIFVKKQGAYCDEEMKIKGLLFEGINIFKDDRDEILKVQGLIHFKTMGFVELDKKSIDEFDKFLKNSSYYPRDHEQLSMMGKIMIKENKEHDEISDALYHLLGLMHGRFNVLSEKLNRVD